MFHYLDKNISHTQRTHLTDIVAMALSLSYTHRAHVNIHLSIGTGGLVLYHTHLPNPPSTASAVCVQSCTQVETSKHATLSQQQTQSR